MNHMKIPGTISAFSPFGKNYYRFPLLDVTFKNAPDFCRAPRTLRENSIRLQRASPGSQDKRAWRRPVGMAEGDIRYDMTGFRWFFFFIGSIYAMIIHDSISKFWHEYSDSKPNREGYWWIYCITWGQFRFFPTRLLEAKLGNRWCQHLFAFNHLECSTTWIIYALRLQRSMDTYGMFVFGHQLEAEASAMSGFVFVFRSIKEF